jgi:dTDP-N-acetylfucosamine:lipid II N-acetylfucosaminyltransferase
MNYHLMIDQKFIDKFIESAELVAPGKNVFIITSSFPGTFVKSPKGIFALPFSNEFNKIIEGINENDRVYIHWFEKYLIDVVNKLAENIPVYLFFWGGDFVEQTNEFTKFNFDHLAKKYVLKSEKRILLYFPRNPIGYIKNLNRYFQALRMKKLNLEEQKNARIQFLKRLSFFCHWNHLDLGRVVAAYGGKPVLLDFFYDVSLDKISKPGTNKKLAGATVNIWLGNSDTLTNNHFDAFVSLKKFRNDNIKLFCPLSYHSGVYEKYVTKQGLKYFNEKWNPITEFMAISDYMQLMETIDVVVMYHNRTQAAGNIFAFVKMGKKVFLKKQSTIYSLMMENGIKVFDSNTIKDLSFEEFSKPLSPEEIEMNFIKISGLFSDEKRLFYLNRILN